KQNRMGLLKLHICDEPLARSMCYSCWNHFDNACQPSLQSNQAEKQLFPHVASVRTKGVWPNMGKSTRLSVLLLAVIAALAFLARAPFAAALPDPAGAKQQVAAAGAGAPANDAKKDPNAPKQPFSAKELRRVLAEPTDKLKTGIDKGTPLKDALDYIFKIHTVRPGEAIPYRIDYRAFADRGEPNIEEKQVDLP